MDATLEFRSDLLALEARAGLKELIRSTAAIASSADDALVVAVVSSRHAGITWEEIGNILGTTRQGAWKRFEKFVPFDKEIERTYSQRKRRELTTKGKE